jgi:hypothetical protein
MTPPSPEPFPPSGASISEELLVRLARLEEQMRHVVAAVDKLAERDSELESGLRAMSDRFSVAMSTQAEALRDSLQHLTDKFVSREDWAFWKSLLTAGVIAMIAYGWHAMLGSFGLHR